MISSGQTAIGTAATPIDGVWANPSRITLHNADNTDAVYIGNGNVTITNGLGVEKLQTLQFDLQPLEQLHAVSSKTGHVISWLRQTI